MSEQNLPPQVLTEIDSPIRETRLTGVDELARLVTGADLAMAAAARIELRRLAEDDSRSVATAAARVLERTAVRLRPDRVDFGPVPPEIPQVVADVLLEGPPLAVETATLTVSGPGLHARLSGRRLRIAWLPESDWLDGLITVRGPAGWADVRVTGQVSADVPMPPPVAAPPTSAPASTFAAPTPFTPPPTFTPPSTFATPPTLATAGRPARAPVPPAAPAAPLRRPPRHRRRGVKVLIGGLTAVVLLGGGAIAMALDRGDRRDPAPAAALIRPPATAPASDATGHLPAPPAPAGLTRVPLAQGVRSVGRPSVLGTIRVGDEPEGVAVAPDSRTVYVANQHSRILSIVDPVSRRVTPVRLRDTPRFVSTSLDGDLVFVSMYEDDKSGSGVAVVSAAEHRVLRYMGTGVQPYALAVGPDGRVWVPIHSKRSVEIFTSDGRRTAGQVTVPPNPHAVAFSAGLKRAFTPNHESNAVAVIDTSTNRLLRSVPVSRSPHSVAVSPDGRTVLVAGYDADTADLLDARTLRRTGPIPVGKQPQSVAFATDGAHAYVVNEGDDTVSVLDGRTGAVTATVRVGGSPRTIAVSPDGTRAYVSDGDDDTITVLRVGE